MIPLKDDLIRLAASLGDSPTAVIVDDELGLDDGRSLSDWLELLEVLRGEPEFMNTLERFLDEQGHNIDEPPSADLWKAIKATLTFPTADEFSFALRQYEEREQVVSALANFLQEIGFEIRCYRSKPNIEDIQAAQLFLVDYQLIPETSEGESAKRIFEELMRACSGTGEAPPLVILMSKKIESAEVNTWEDVGRCAGFYRCNFDFINKTEFESDPAIFSLKLLSLLQHKPVADAYYSQLRTCSTVVLDESNLLIKELFQVTPSEAQVFESRLAKEGTALAETCLNLFTAHLVRRIERSSIMRDRMGEFAAAIARDGVVAPHSSHRNVLYRLHAELLFDKCDDGVISPPSFGDLYEDESGILFLVLSQECDIKIREDGEPKKDQIFTVEGAIRDMPKQSGDSESILSHPLVMEDDRLRWLHLDTARPRVFDFNSIIAVPYRKRFRMHRSYAESIRHAFVFQLTRVGLDVMPDFVAHVQCGLYSERQGKLLLGEVGLYQIGLPPDAYYAFSPDTKPMYAGLEYPFISPDQILGLSKFLKRSDFIGRLSRLRILPYSDERCERFVLCKTASGTPSEATSNWLKEQGYAQWT